ncbi:MAG: topoisomerase C-terminal repeat-containing protein, partial [Variovorax sp.]
LTYPRTDSRALPEDYLPTVKETLDVLTAKTGLTAPYAPFAARILRQGWVKPNKRIFNDAKISDHFAIIPTLQAPKSLSEPEQKLYDLVTKRFLAVFFPSAEFLVTTRITRVQDEPFKTEGRVMVDAGWLAVYGKEMESGDAPILAPVTDGSSNKRRRRQGQSDQAAGAVQRGTLLSAMEGAGKLVEDEDLREAMSARGLGTPATRASVIEGWCMRNISSAKAAIWCRPPKRSTVLCAVALRHRRVAFARADRQLGAQAQADGAGPARARRVHAAHRRDDRRSGARIKTGTSLDEPIATLDALPQCGGAVNENYKKFQCTACDFSMWKVIASRRVEAHEVEALFTERVIGPLQGFRSRIGRPFAALLKLKDDFSIELDYGQSSQDDANAEPVDFSAQAPLGPCPKCAANVYEHGIGYVCEKAIGPGKICDFRSGKVILQRPIEREQMVKLLATGKTDLLQRFISKKGRPFNAFLVRQPDGKVGFEFAPRAAKPGAKKNHQQAPRRPSMSRHRAVMSRRRQSHRLRKQWLRKQSSKSARQAGTNADDRRRSADR